jgi:trans-aconitate methyltransferase
MNTPPSDHHERVQRLFHSAVDDYVRAFMDVSRYQAALDVFMSSLPQDVPVLEVGCGPGNITRYLLDRRPDLHIRGIDLAPAMVDHARQHCPEAEFQQGDARSIDQLKGPYSGVVCGFLLPYLSVADTAQLFHAMKRLLAPRGVLYLSTMEDDPAKSGPRASSSGKYEAIHQQFYTEIMLKTMLKEAGLRVTHGERATYTDASNKPVTDLMLIATHS